MGADYVSTVGDMSALPLRSQPFMQAIVTGINTPKQIAVADPMRVLLVVSGDATQPYTLGNSSAVASQKGIVLATAAPIIIFTQQEHGPLPALEWWVVSPGAGNVGVLSCSLSLWPDQLPGKGIDEYIQRAINVHKIRSARNFRRAKLYGHSWGEREEAQNHRLPYFGNASLD